MNSSKSYSMCLIECDEKFLKSQGPIIEKQVQNNSTVSSKSYHSTISFLIHLTPPLYQFLQLDTRTLSGHTVARPN